MGADRLLGLHELAAYLGVSKERVRVLRKTHADFPAPAAELRATPVWVERDVSRWVEAHPERPPAPGHANGGKPAGGHR